MTWIIYKANRIHTHSGVAYESVHLLARGHMIRVSHVSDSLMVKFHDFQPTDGHI